jgi:hypothetical protein
MNEEQGGKTDAQARAEAEAPFPTPAGVRAPSPPAEIHAPPEPHESGAYLMRGKPAPHAHKK